MSVKLVYLDSSSIVKRYIEEKGSEIIDTVYEKAEASKFRFVFSIWNVGEAFGAFDRYFTRGLLSEHMFKTAMQDFLSESIKMSRLGILQIMPITSKSFIESWQLILRYHIYGADALQISTSKEAACDLLLSADRRLVHAAKEEGVKAINVEEEPEKAFKSLE